MKLIYEFIEKDILVYKKCHATFFVSRRSCPVLYQVQQIWYMVSIYDTQQYVHLNKLIYRIIFCISCSFIIALTYKNVAWEHYILS